MRIITGSARGRRLKAPEGLSTRPILDAQKEMLFNVLGARVIVAGVYDIFAGTGGLGLEALSRGAGAGTFVESGRKALPCLRENIAACGFAEIANVVTADAYRLDWGRFSHDADLVFLDPPFPDFVDRREALEKLLLAVATSHRVRAGALIVWRMPEEATEVTQPAMLEEIDRRESGRSIILILKKAP